MRCGHGELGPCPRSPRTSMNLLRTSSRGGEHPTTYNVWPLPSNEPAIGWSFMVFILQLPKLLF